MLHPFMPFVTEEIWGYLPGREQPLIISAWVQADRAYIRDDAETEMNVLMDMVRGIRNVRAEYEVDPSKRITAMITPGGHRANIEKYSYLFSRMCNVAETEIVSDAPADSASIVVSDATLYLPLAGMIDFAAELERLEKDLNKLNEQIAKTQGMLANEGFVARAKPEVVQRERDRLAELQASATQIEQRISQIRTRV